MLNVRKEEYDSGIQDQELEYLLKISRNNVFFVVILT